MEMCVVTQRLPAILVALALSACVAAPIDIDRSELAGARAAIEQARAARAEKCAPELMAGAQSRLYWAAHELSEEHQPGGYMHEARDLIAQAESYARQAREAAMENCRDITTVILMPDEDGTVGSVLVQAGGASQAIDQAYHFTEVSGKTKRPEPLKSISEDQFNSRFADILSAQPPKPAHFILYFVSGTSEVTAASKALIPEVLRAAQERQPAEVSIVGHTDATGSAAINMKISAERAKAVESLLKSSESPPGSIYLRFHGENDPLVPTPDNVPEPRNRRVEIIIL